MVASTCQLVKSVSTFPSMCVHQSGAWLWLLLIHTYYQTAVSFLVRHIHTDRHTYHEGRVKQSVCVTLSLFHYTISSIYMLICCSKKAWVYANCIILFEVILHMVFFLYLLERKFFQLKHTAVKICTYHNSLLQYIFVFHTREHQRM